MPPSHRTRFGPLHNVGVPGLSSFMADCVVTPLVDRQPPCVRFDVFSYPYVAAIAGVEPCETR